MNTNIFDAGSGLIPKSFLTQAQSANVARQNAISQLIEQRKLPAKGWSDHQIESFLAELSFMDSNNFHSNCGVGEREGRIYSGIVTRRHFHMSHGIGRSGDLMEAQPKAAGSSLLSQLVNQLAADALKISGIQKSVSCFVVPMATGMTMTLCLLTLRHQRPSAKYVIWPRIDQKSCFKAIITAGYEPIIVENSLHGDELQTDLDKIICAVTTYGAANILCILSTTSCFAPRGIDQLQKISKISENHAIPHIINNAYGVQSSKCMHEIQQAARVGRVDIVVQSTDKNFMVPVGGSIVATFEPALAVEISKNYPGRASAAPSVDLLITLLSLGADGWRNLLKSRKLMFQQLQQKLGDLASSHGQRLLATPSNPISLGMTLPCGMSEHGESVTKVGAMLFTRCVSGARVLSPAETKTIAGHLFVGWGCHHQSYPNSYLTAAAAIGITEQDIDLFVQRLDRVLTKWTKSSVPHPPSDQPNYDDDLPDSNKNLPDSSTEPKWRMNPSTTSGSSSGATGGSLEQCTRTPGSPCARNQVADSGGDVDLTAPTIDLRRDVASVILQPTADETLTSLLKIPPADIRSAEPGISCDKVTIALDLVPRQVQTKDSSRVAVTLL